MGTYNPRSVPLYRALSEALNQIANCEESGNTEWLTKTRDRVRALAKRHFPSGSGIDAGATLDLGKSTSERLVIETSYHHTHESGMYDGWTEHTITVTPSLQFGLEIKISGRNRNDVKSYLHEVFYDVLRSEVDPYPDTI